MRSLPFIEGDFKTFPKSENETPADEFEVMALAKRLGITIDEMKEMSFVSLFNILISSTSNGDDERQATQDDIEKLFG